MADTTQFELVSPEKLLLSEQVEMVVVPGAEGDFGVLPGHAPFISTIRPGVIAVYRGTEIVERIFVAGGFAEVTAERCTVLADEAIPVSALDRAVVEAELRVQEGAVTQLRDAAARAPAGEADAAMVQLKQAELAYAVAAAKSQAIEGAAAH